MNPWLFILSLFFISDMIAAMVSAWMFWGMRGGNRNRMVVPLVICFVCLFLRGLCELCANAHGYTVKPVPTSGFAWFYWTGRAVSTLGMWGVVWSLNGKQK